MAGADHRSCGGGGGGAGGKRDRRHPHAPGLAPQGAGCLAVRSPRSFTTAGAVPAGFQPESFTAISEFTWWLLGTAPCGSHTCTAIVQTTDGGSTFTRIPAPPTATVSVRFADASDGYAYGRQLWTTHDDGKTWTQQRLGATVDELAIADGYVYALVLSHDRSSLMRSAVGADQWSTIGGLGRGYLSSLWVQGSTVIIQSGNRLMVSNDQGMHFVRVRGVLHAGDCGYDAVAGPFAIWALCTTGMAPDDILLSTDSGNTFTTAAQVPNGPIDAFAAASSSVAVASGQGWLYRTTNSGGRWIAAAAPPPTGPTSASPTRPTASPSATSASGGRQQDRLYYTTDAGASYHYVPIGPT